MRYALILIPALVLAACAGGPPRPGSYGAELAALTRDCEARGGVLTPSGASTGRAATDNTCVIRGGASRIP